MAEYTSPNAVLRAISDVAKRQTKRSGGTASAFVELEYRARLLARVFAPSDPGWVLKGGTSTLVRIPDARATKDIDLLREKGTVEAAIEELKALAVTDLGDFFHFELLTASPTLENDGQGAREGAEVVFDVYCGQKKLNRISVDLVVSSAPLLGEIETLQSPLAEKLPRLPHGHYRLYPLIDHIADKACAMVEIHSGDRLSTRSKDLVDIVTYASIYRLESRPLRQAIVTEARLRDLSIVDFAGRVPADSWENSYKTAAARIPHCHRHPTVGGAVELVQAFIDGAVAAKRTPRVWSPELLTWKPMELF